MKSERWFVKLALESLRHRRLASISAKDLDRCVAQLCKQMSKGTVADGCSAIRAFLRFLHATGKAPTNQAVLVAGPRVRRMERPPRALPWPDVRRIVQSVDRSTAMGQRDYALLLLIAAYGLRAGEALQIRVEDVDFRGGVLRVHRSKTGVETLLPLLPAVARALLDHLRRGRPRKTASREIFLRARAPFKPLSCAGAVGHILRKHAAAAGVSAPFLGSHALRHSHASRQVEAGVSPKVLGDILGHADPQSTSVYVRVPSRQLRALALPVPR